MVKSEAKGEYVMTKPANVDAKESTEDAVAGAAAGGLDRCLPPIPSATIYTISTGIHIIRSYLRV